MAKQFDATLNSLIDLSPQDWASCFARLCGIPPGPSTVLDTDLATTVQADRLFRVDGESPTLLHLELESSPRSGIPRELLRYNVLSDFQQDLPVETVLILLRPKAFASDQTGLYRRTGPRGNLIAEFRYSVIKVWEHPVEFWLENGLGLCPLSLLTDEAAGNLESALLRLERHLKNQSLAERLERSLISSSYILCGLRYFRDEVDEYFGRLSIKMEDSTTYQGILEKGFQQGIAQGITQGVTQGERRALLRQGTKRFGPPSPEVVASLEAIDEPARLEFLLERLLDVTSWEELLAPE